jgi:hypothetical protein
VDYWVRATVTSELSLDLSLEGSLPFNEKRQLAFLGYVMDYESKNIFLQVKDRIEPAWFLNPWAAKLYDAYRKWYDTYHNTPKSKDELLSYPSLYTLNPAEKQKIGSVETLCQSEKTNYTIEAIMDDLTNWLKCRIYHKTVAESARLFNDKQLGPAVALLANTVKEFQEIRFEGTPPANWNDPKGLVESQEVEYSNALTTGLTLFDKKLNPDCKKGALLRGDTTIILAPLGVGKTRTCVTIIRHNVR